MTKTPLTARDPRLDFFRGLCLAMIFINHVPGQIYETFTSRNFGFTDAAEGFVFMSGAAAGLAYTIGMMTRPLWPTVGKIWGRVWLLYLVHVMTAFLAIAISAATMKFFGVDTLLERANVQWLGKDMLGFLIGVPTLGHQLGYVNILPMYMVLLAVAPLMIKLAHWRVWALLATVTVIWAVAGQFRIDLPNYPTQGGWFFNPISWSMIFALGLATGIRLKQGRRLVPVNKWLTGFAIAYLVLSVVWLKHPDVNRTMAQSMSYLWDHGFPFWVVGMDKTYVALPRLLHLMSLAYLLSLPGPIRLLAASRWVAPIVTLGRNSLPVFALGTVLAFVGQAIKVTNELNFWQDTALILTGLTLQWALARAREWHKAQMKAPKPVVAPA
ncbi:OpgC family protein [Albirhodobacter sp. R86504]|uniref:OpgC family protein n=1 Tax=Albirhodobacter sp. R86504 TaxID=3093848 RepID=UPI00366B0B8E